MIRRHFVTLIAGGLAACSSSTQMPGGGSNTPPDGGTTTPPVGSSKLTFESGPVRPLALSVDGSRVFVTNTPNGTLDILRVTAGGLVFDSAVKVGLEPVAVAVRNPNEVWVVNTLSDSVSVVDVAAAVPHVTRTLLVGDEPSDIVFAGNGRAFITTAHRGQQRTSPDLVGVIGAGDPQLTTNGVGRADVWVFDPINLGTNLGGRPLEIVTLFGDTPRGLAVSPDGTTVYAAVFHSGNQSMVTPPPLSCLGFDDDTGCVKNGVQVPGSPPGPATNFNGKPAPSVAMMVKVDATGKVRDVRNRDWTAITPFSIPDQDVFAIDATTLTQNGSFAHVGTTLFNLAVNPKSGVVYVSNTESRNDLRFEGPGTFVPGVTLQGHLAETRITVLNGSQVLPRHLNKHIDYTVRPAPAGVKDHSLSTPLDMAVSDDGKTLYVAAFGSAKIGVFATADLEADTFDPTQTSANYLPVTGGGPAGLALDTAGHLFVATRFDDGVSMFDLGTGTEKSHVQLVNPEVEKITKGRHFLYDAQASSSNGEASCASCHMFGDTDTMGWDLGNPDADTVETPINVKGKLGATKTINGNGDVQSLHPLKGPMITQTLRGMANHGTMHWRGDRVSGFFGTDTALAPPYNSELAFKNFIVAFDGLLGRDSQIANDDMQTFSDFALSIIMPPNPVRNLDNSLTDAQARGKKYFMGCDGTDSVTLQPVVCQDNHPVAPGQGHFADGVAGMNRGNPCQGCHRIDPTMGFFGTDGSMSFDGGEQTMKIPQLRNVYTKIGRFGAIGDPTNSGPQVRANGFQHTGAVDSVFGVIKGVQFASNADGSVGFAGGDPQRRDVEQFVLAFENDLAPIVGQQVTLDGDNQAEAGPRIDLMVARSQTPFTSKVLGGVVTECELVARGVVNGRARTYTLAADGTYVPDDGSIALTDLALRQSAAVPGQEITFTCLPPGWTH